MTSSTAFTDLWSRLEHRFGEVDGCVMPCAALRPDVSRTLESLVKFEQALRIFIITIFIFRE